MFFVRGKIQEPCRNLEEGYVNEVYLHDLKLKHKYASVREVLS